jgi:hypothetical protein
MTKYYVCSVCKRAFLDRTSVVKLMSHKRKHRLAGEVFKFDLLDTKEE